MSTADLSVSGTTVVQTMILANQPTEPQIKFFPKASRGSFANRFVSLKGHEVYKLHTKGKVDVELPNNAVLRIEIFQGLMDKERYQAHLEKQPAHEEYDEDDDVMDGVDRGFAGV